MTLFWTVPCPGHRGVCTVPRTEAKLGRAMGIPASRCAQTPRIAGTGLTASSSGSRSAGRGSPSVTARSRWLRGRGDEHWFGKALNKSGHSLPPHTPAARYLWLPSLPRELIQVPDVRTRKSVPQRMSQREARSVGLRGEPVDEVPSAKGGRAYPQGNLKVTLILFIPKPVPDGKRPWEVSVPKITTNSLGPWSLWRARGLDKSPSHSWVLGEAARGTRA